MFSMVDFITKLERLSFEVKARVTLDKVIEIKRNEASLVFCPSFDSSIP